MSPDMNAYLTASTRIQKSLSVHRPISLLLSYGNMVVGRMMEVLLISIVNQRLFLSISVIEQHHPQRLHHALTLQGHHPLVGSRGKPLYSPSRSSTWNWRKHDSYTTLWNISTKLYLTLTDNNDNSMLRYFLYRLYELAWVNIL